MSITKTKLKVGLKGASPVLDGELFASVKPEDCYWNISDGRVVEITLQKVNFVHPSRADYLLSCPQLAYHVMYH